MPDKNQDWTPDEAFWNEAWADMEKRLDNKRRGAVWLPWLLGLALLLGGGALVHYLTATEANPLVSNPDTQAPFPVAVENSPSGRLTPRDQAVAVSEVDPAEVFVPGPIRGEKPVAQPMRPAPASTPQPKARSTSEEPATAGYAVGLLPFPALEGLPLSLSLPESEIRSGVPTPPIVAVRPPVRWSVAAGFTVFPGGWLPGAFVDAGTRFRLGEKGFVPLTLRLAYDRRGSRVDRDSDLRESLDLNSPIAAPNNGVTLADELSQTRTGRVRTFSLELRAGYGRQVTEKLSFSGGGSVAYLLWGKGPLLYVSSGSNSNYLLSSAQFDLPAFRNQSQTYSGYGYESATTIHRWGVNGWLQADYRFGRRFGARAGLSYALSPLYESEALRREPLRIEVGGLLSF